MRDKFDISFVSIFLFFFISFFFFIKGLEDFIVNPTIYFSIIFFDFSPTNKILDSFYKKNGIKNCFFVFLNFLFLHFFLLDIILFYFLFYLSQLRNFFLLNFLFLHFFLFYLYWSYKIQLRRTWTNGTHSWKESPWVSS